MVVSVMSHYCITQCYAMTLSRSPSMWRLYHSVMSQDSVTRWCPMKQGCIKKNPRNLRFTPQYSRPDSFFQRLLGPRTSYYNFEMYLALFHDPNFQDRNPFPTKTVQSQDTTFEFPSANPDECITQWSLITVLPCDVLLLYHSLMSHYCITQWWPMTLSPSDVKLLSPVAWFMGPTWGPSETDRTQVGPMLATGTLLSGVSPCIPHLSHPWLY